MRRFFNLIGGHKNWLGYLFRKISSNKKQSFIFKTRSGFNIEVPARLMHTYKECFLDETYLKGFSNNPITNDHPIAIDIGANVGYFSLNFFSKYPKATIIAFEPIPNNFELLKSYKAKFNQLHFNIHNEAVSGKEGELEIFYDKKDSFSTSATLFKHTAEPDSIKVKTTTLAQILKKRDFNKVDLLKLDCEGAEYEILYNAPQEVLNSIKAIAIETHLGKGEKENINSLNQFLQNNGFRTLIIRSKIWAERSFN